MAVRKGLGKGLDIMIPEQINSNADEVKDVSRETLIKINEIEPNRNQPRKKFDEESLQELADSIRKHGIIQPLILQKKGKFYEIIAGERRWRAARLAGLKEVPAIIKDYSPQQAVEIALIENLQREDLNPIEEAQTYQRLIQEFNLKQEEVAERVSKSRVAITNSMRLLKLDERVQQMLIESLLSGGHGRALLAIENKEKQYELACKIVDEKLSVRETEKLVKKLLTEKPVGKRIISDDKEALIYRDIENRIRNIIGSKVSIHKKKNKGTIEIEFYSNDELERIIELFDVIQSGT
ncbi:MAG: ParB/RepB/Spo0J family partition protein [Clostridiales bacterium]|nr:ParB/RepB/Spo0J family partition protein [Clostridiales bacterium]